MASVIATIVIGSIFNATTFIGGSYLAKKLSGKNQDLERKRHDKAVEKYSKDYNEWKNEQEKGQLWNEKDEKKRTCKYKIRDTDQNLKRYYEAHPEEEFFRRRRLNFKN